MCDDVFGPLSPRRRPMDMDDLNLERTFAEEAVRVDRRRLERIQQCENGLLIGSQQDPQQFIRNVMSETGTEITWCDQGRPRTGPTVMIAGDSARVKEAKERINSFFNCRQDRVTLKLDVSFDAHSHIIGRGGRSIQRVMDATYTHVHFPDSNRTSTFEKSNQVSIAGTASGAEKARCQVRDLMPLTINYELPLNTFNRQAMDTSSVFYQMLQRNFSITVAIQPVRIFGDFFDFGEPSVIKVSIRGTKGLIDQMEQGTALLLDQVTNGTYNLSSTPATCDIEIAVQNHTSVIGRNDCNVRDIMQMTNAMISFPEQSPVPYIGPAASSLPNRKSTVNIKGPNFNSVFAAWDALQGFLPLILIFDLNEGQHIDAMFVARLMEKHKVSIQVKPKVRQNVNSIIVKGTEKDSRTLFEVRRELLGLDSSEVPYCCSNHFFKKFSESYDRANSLPQSPLTPALTPGNYSPSSYPDFDQIWGQPVFSRPAAESVGSCPTANWTLHNCQRNHSERTQQDFLSSDRPSILDSTGPRDNLATILTKAGLERYANQFADLSLRQFINMTPETFCQFPFSVRQQLSTLISQLKWLVADNSQRF